MTKTIWVVRAPESESRPERYIADEIISSLTSDSLSGWSVREIDANHPGRDPLAGKSFYDNKTFKEHFLKTAQKITNLVKDGDRILFIEGFSPLISFLDYWFFVEEKTVEMSGIFHSSTTTPGDLFFQDPKMMDMERSILGSLENVFVATDYLANNLRIAHPEYRGRILQVGLPFNAEVYLQVPAKPKKIVMWSHRWAADKNKHLFLALADEMPGYKFLILNPNPLEVQDPSDIEQISRRRNITWLHCPTKKEYREALYKDQGFFFSSATLETFGYSFLEAVNANWYPIVPNFASYKEMTAPHCKYTFDPSRSANPAYVRSLSLKLSEKISTAYAAGGKSKTGKAIPSLVKNFYNKYGQSAQIIKSTLNK